MSASQLATRQAIADLCAAAGWSPLEENAAFEEGRWVNFQAIFEKRVNDLRVLLRYRAEKDILYIAIEKQSDRKGVHLEVRDKSRLREVTEILCARADQADSTNYKDLLKAMLTVCPSIWAAIGDEDTGRMARLVI